MIKIIIAFSLLFSTLLDAKSVVNYYKCVNERGSTYSQFPCGQNATQHTLSHSDPDVAIPSEQHYKTLNQLEKKQLVRNLKKSLRAKRHEVAILNRDRDRATRDQQERIRHVMDDKKRKETVKDIKKQLKSINRKHKKEVKVVTKQIARIEKKLKRYE
ncbi:hypothetical protein CWB96_18380 [Pseudoalteromonas citrea]|uniref:DUF4124 domain-containing protein n=2 Tax=Pseudoalteromonas TaxID=53246 RepID=A0A5S3V9C7_9GAMM|nr:MULTISPECIES: DUF4124 domain-containing protein [Pseudoalteromonas]RJE78104.1 hypothetical protein BGP78_06225 [Pseudoalteromonas sp. MSK9-3]TMO67287.1 hypothetical protein CWC18_01135 [Pseudoalteromonas aurantia]TMO68322.1 hypothetical protein CWC19_10215 [Pseudoalteromonas aurantia]TMO70851.1 hypothetical protein CWC20_18915 [Pseudoalteromonas aurantia]TMP40745.1 hypothetical protein CWB97_17060 [Pseudoalteromonas citrea]